MSAHGQQFSTIYTIYIFKRIVVGLDTYTIRFRIHTRFTSEK